MNNLIMFYMVYLVFSAIFAGAIGGLVLAIIEVYDMDSCLHSAKEFFKCVFQWQVFVLRSGVYVNKTGVIVLEVLTTLSVWHLNLLALLALLILEIIRVMVILFIKVFRKKEDK